jgi:hypothetical protein
VTWGWKPGDAISRRLFEALRLEIRYDHTAYMATCEITLTRETIGTVARTSQERRQRQPAGGHAARPTTEPMAPKLTPAAPNLNSARASLRTPAADPGGI